MIRGVAILSVLSLAAACGDATVVRNAPQSLSPSGGATGLSPVMVATSAPPTAVTATAPDGTVVVVAASPAPVTEMNAGATFGSDAGRMIADAMFR